MVNYSISHLTALIDVKILLIFYFTVSCNGFAAVLPAHDTPTTQPKTITFVESTARIAPFMDAAISGPRLESALYSVDGATSRNVNSTSTPFPVKQSILVNHGRIDASILLNGQGTQALRDSLSKIPLGFIPKPLGEMTLTREEAETKLGSYAKYLALPSKLQFRRNGEILGGREIAAKITEYCTANSTMKRADEIQVDLSRIPDHIVLPGALISWNIKPMSTNPVGMILFSLEAECVGGTVRQVFQTQVSYFIKAAKLTRLLRPGQIICNEDIVEDKIKIKQSQGQNYVLFSEALGKKLLSFKSPGTLIRSNDLLPEMDLKKVKGVQAGTRSTSSGKKDADWAIKPGEKVEFFVKSGGLSLMVPAKAVQGGKIGDTIKLINLQNNRFITGIITSERRVEYGQN